MALFFTLAVVFKVTVSVHCGLSLYPKTQECIRVYLPVNLRVFAQRVYIYDIMQPVRFSVSFVHTVQRGEPGSNQVFGPGAAPTSCTRAAAAAQLYPKNTHQTRLYTIYVLIKNTTFIVTTPKKTHNALCLVTSKHRFDQILSTKLIMIVINLAFIMLQT